VTASASFPAFSASIIGDPPYPEILMATPVLDRRCGCLGASLALLRGVRFCTPMRQLSTHPQLRPSRPFALHFGRLYALRREVRSVGHRTSETHGTAGDERRVQLTRLRVSPVEQRDAMILAHNWSIRNLQSRYPRMTDFDVGLCLEDFAAGASRQCNPCKEERQTRQP
jgi:hypothetical protein